jgi:hypothetical protein
VALGWNPERPISEATQAFMKHVRERSVTKAGSRASLRSPRTRT